MKSVYIIHGWDGSPEEPLHTWLKEGLEERGYKVIMPEMPNVGEPHIEAWVGKLKEIIKIEEKPVLVGHSIGCQTILRYLADLPEGQQVKSVILLAPWTNLNMEVIKEEGEASIKIANEWINTPINFQKAKEHVGDGITAIFSDDDPVVPFSEKEVFEKEINAEILIEYGKGHFTEEDNVKELPSLLEEVIRRAGE